MENAIAPSTPLVARTTRTSGTSPTSRTWLWVGRVCTGLAIAFLLFDAFAKLIVMAPVVEATQRLGYSVAVIRPLGVLLAVSTLLHVIPRTQLIGALLLTAYLGGATATLVRTGSPFWFPVVLGSIIWLTYYQRSPSLRALFSPQSR